jgi:hypothetical protein
MTILQHDALEVCLQALETGASIDDCLALYPNFTQELIPVLEAAQEARSLSVEHVPVDAMIRSRTRMLGRANEFKEKGRIGLIIMRLPRVAVATFIALLFLILSSSGLLVASAESLPGDTLYPLKRAVEDVRIRMTPGEDQKKTIEAGINHLRLLEVNELIKLGKVQRSTFEGVVEETSHDRWIVSGIPVFVNAHTKLIGDIKIGNLVEIDGETTSEGWIDAHEIILREYEFIGEVQSVDENQWMISGVAFIITKDTRLTSGINLGDIVIVLVRTDPDENFYALAIIRVPHSSMSPIEELSEDDFIDDSGHDEDINISGVIDELNSEYLIIDGHVIYINDRTEIEDDIQVGDYVEIQILIDQVGSWFAEQIEWGDPDNEDNEITDENYDIDDDAEEDDVLDDDHQESEDVTDDEEDSGDSEDETDDLDHSDDIDESDEDSSENDGSAESSGLEDDESQDGSGDEGSESLEEEDSDDESDDSIDESEETDK